MHSIFTTIIIICYNSQTFLNSCKTTSIRLPQPCGKNIWLAIFVFNMTISPLIFWKDYVNHCSGKNTDSKWLIEQKPTCYLNPRVKYYCINISSGTTFVFKAFYQFFFHQLVGLQKLWKMLFISSKKLFSFSRDSNFCIFFPFIPQFPGSKGQMEVE